MKQVATIIQVELKQYRWTILLWALALSTLAVLTLSVYGSVQDQTAQLGDALQHIPAAVKNLFSDTGDLTSPIGFLSSKLYYLTYPLVLTILGISLARSLLGQEESSHTLELLLARPVSRGSILLAKAITGLVVLLLVSAITLTATMVTVKAVGIAVPLAHIAGAMAMTFLISLVFSTLAFTLTAIGGVFRTAAMGITALFALGGYIIVSLAQSVDWLDAVKIFSPYHYYHPTTILNGTFTTPEALGMLVTVVILGFISWACFRRRDIA